MDRITLRNLRIVGAYDGAPGLNHVVGAVVSGGDRGHRARHPDQPGRHNVVVANTVLGTRVEQGILVDGSPRVVLADNVVDASDEEGIRVVSSAHCVVYGNAVRDSQGGNGITVSRSAGASIVESVVVGSYRDGLRVMNCVDLVLSRNRAEANGNVGLRVEQSPPFASVDDVLAQGNVGMGNEGGEVVVEAKGCASSACEPGTTLPTVTTTTSLHHHIGVGYPHLVYDDHDDGHLDHAACAAGGGSLAVLRPHLGHCRGFAQRPRAAPLGRRPGDAAIREDHLSAFRIGDRVSGTDLLALGGDTRQRLGAAAETYLRAHPAAYATFAEVLELRWAERAGP